jgi:predicted choloylglycine hydrolase
VDLLWKQTLSIGADMVENFPPTHREEFNTLRNSLPPEFRDHILAGNTMFDIKKLVNCSALVVEKERVKAGTTGPLLGRNLDFPSLNYLHHFTLVTVYRPNGKHAFVSVTFPGLVGVLSGMNEKGLSLGVLEIYQSADGSEVFNKTGVPYAMILRRVLEECSTVEEALTLLQNVKRTTRFNLAICDREGGGVFEVTPKQVLFRRPYEGLTPCTNHFCVKGLAHPEQSNIFQTKSRFSRLEHAYLLKQLGVSDVQDHLHAANLGDLTLQTMVLEPSSLKLHLAVGKTPASQEPMRTLELAPLFRK